MYLHKDSYRYGRNTPHWSLKVWNQKRNQKIILASFEHFQKLYWRSYGYLYNLYINIIMGVAGLIFEPHPPNFEIQYFEDVQMVIFFISLLVSDF